MYKLFGEVKKVNELSGEFIDKIFLLMNSYYDNLIKGKFLKDLYEKDYIIWLKTDIDEIVGFSTQKIIKYKLESGEIIRGIFSGDTIIDKKYWGSSELMKTWIKFALEQSSKFDSKDFYWFLISKGYKTYRMLPVHFKKFYPNKDEKTPKEYKILIDEFGKYRYPNKYNKETGVIEYKGTSDKLKDGIADFDELKLKNPDINFFLQANPNCINGDDIVCIAKISKENFKPQILKRLCID